MEGISFSPELPKFINQKLLKIEDDHFYSNISLNFPSKSCGDWASAIWSGSQLKNINNRIKFILNLGFMAQTSFCLKIRRDWAEDHPIPSN
jgi:hypothetical protein